MDGVDAVLVSIEAPDGRLSVIESFSHSLPDSLREDLLSLSQNQGSPELLGSCDHRLGHLYADTVLALLSRASVDPALVTAIGSHGQTIRHHPDPPVRFTQQIGDPNLIAERTGITTVADFRRRDMAAGGQGAPLAPAFHHAAFHSDQENRCLLNLGGIANITWLPRRATAEVTGFDTGPANSLLDAWCQRHLDEPFDHNGDWSRSGHVDNALLETLLSEPYFGRSAPKSTGKELFNLAWLERHLARHPGLLPVDIQRTLVELTAQTVAEQVPADEPLTLYACGGGVRNCFLMERIQARMPETRVQSTEALGVDPQRVEGAAFAWLAHQTLNGLAGNLPAVTGARGGRVLGGIYPGTLRSD